MPGPTWAVSPSMVCLPQITMATSSIVSQHFGWLAVSTLLVASVSAPPKARSLSSMASSAPSARALRSVISALGGPMEMAADLEAVLVLEPQALLQGMVSNGLMMNGTPSRISVPVVGVDLDLGCVRDLLDTGDGAQDQALK